jgi:Ala-tRNA(Pro) deacylase
MQVFERLVELFTREQARFRVVEHDAAGRSEHVAAVRGTALGQGAKALVCLLPARAGEAARAVLAIIPGDRRLDGNKLARVFGQRKTSFAPAEEAQRLTGCVIGSIPPVSFDGLPVVCDRELAGRYPEIAFNAGRLDRSIVLAVEDYLRIVRPQLADIQRV